MITRTQRSIVVTAAVAAIVIAANASDGAYFSQSWGWVALAFLVPSSVLLILDRVAAPGRLRIAFACLMGALGVWTAASMIWSMSPSGSAREVERMLVYVALSLAVALVLRRGDGPRVVAGALLGVTVVTGHGLAMKLFPDRFDVPRDIFNGYRLAEPLGYGNAFGVLIVVGVILAVAVIAHARRGWTAAAGGASMPLLVVALYLSFSRGAWGALFVGLGAVVFLDPRRITVLWSLLLVAPVSAVGIAVASRQDALTMVDVSELAAARDGHRLAWLLVALTPCSGALAWLAHRVSRQVDVSVAVRRGVAAILAVGAAGAVAAALIAAGGPTSAASELRNRFEAPPAYLPRLNDRLFTFSGNGRAETIATAWNQGVDHPLVGTGAGTFETVWYERRPSDQIVRDAHSLYVETFAELGVVGLTLLLGALLMPLIAAFRARHSRFVAPACGSYVAWLAAAALDWHWEMVGLTATALLVGAVALVSAERLARDALLDGTRLALLGVTGTLSVVAVWSLVGNQALFAGREAISRKDWSDARDHARRAHALLLWSHEPDLVLGDAAAGAGDRDGAIRAFRDAVDKDPRNWLAWLRLAQVARGAESNAAYDRVRELNPRVEGLPGG